MADGCISAKALTDPHFNMRIMEFLADHRNPAVTFLFTAMSGLGDGRWYVLVVLAIYVAWDKRLAVRLSILMTLSGSLNGILKTSIGNPRPFVKDGTYVQRWAIPARNACALAKEYSTPSGHAMSAGSFYSFLGWSVRNRNFRIAAIAIIFLVGVSRPYLGVHYVEDVLLGWAIGAGVGIVALRYADSIADRWARMPYGGQVIAALVVSGLVWVTMLAVSHWQIGAGASRSLAGDLGIFTGMVIARPLELRIVDFDPRGGSVLFKALRLSITLALMLGSAVGSWWLMGLLAGHGYAVDRALEFVRFGLAGVVSIFAAPWVFTGMGLARRATAR